MRRIVIWSLGLLLGSLTISVAQENWFARTVVRGFTQKSLEGIVIFMEADDGWTVIRGIIRGLQPGHTYAIHIHQWGDCRNPKASGGHFDPYRSGRHGRPDDPIGTHHAGDLPNITADEKGIVQFQFRTKAVTVRPSPFSVLGRAVIIHERADDYTSQPAGNAGTRIACGIIGVVPRETK